MVRKRAGPPRVDGQWGPENAQPALARSIMIVRLARIRLPCGFMSSFHRSSASRAEPSFERRAVRYRSRQLDVDRAVGRGRHAAIARDLTEARAVGAHREDL